MVEKIARWKRKEQQIHSKSQGLILKKTDWIKANAWRLECNVRRKNWPDGKVFQLNFAKYEVWLRHWDSKTYKPIYWRKSLNKQEKCPFESRDSIDKKKHAKSIGLSQKKSLTIFPIYEKRARKWN